MNERMTKEVVTSSSSSEWNARKEMAIIAINRFESKVARGKKKRKRIEKGKKEEEE